MNAKEKFLSVMLLLALIAFVFEAHRASASRLLVQSLQVQQAQSQLQIEQLTRESDRLIRELAAMQEQNHSVANLTGARKANSEAMQSPQDSLEANGAAKDYSENETDGVAHTWADAARRLKERFEQTPSARIPEMQFLNPADWLEVARKADLESESGFRKAMGEIRKSAEGLFTKQFQAALDLYTSAHDGQWPPDLEQLKSYFFPPVDTAILQRWQIVPSATFPGRGFAGDWVLTEKSPVDPDFDSRWTIDSPSDSGVGPYQFSRESQMEVLKETIAPTVRAYMAANEGKQPLDAHDLMAYASGAGQIGALKMFLQMTGTNQVAH